MTNNTTTTLIIETATLAKLAAGVLPCISKEETRYYLNGVYIHAHTAHNAAGAMLRFVSTDGHRMAIFEHDYIAEQCEELPQFDGVIIPAKAALYLSKMKIEKWLASDQQTTAIKITGEHLVIERRMGDVVKETQIFTLIDGTFPDYQRVCPNMGEGHASQFNSELLASLCKGAKAAQDERTVSIAVFNGAYEGAPSWVKPNVKGLSYILMPMRGATHIDNFTTPQTDAQRFNALADAVLNINGGSYEQKSAVRELLQNIAAGLNAGELKQAA